MSQPEDEEKPITMAELFDVDPNDPRLDPVVHQVFDLNRPVEFVKDEYFTYPEGHPSRPENLREEPGKK